MSHPRISVFASSANGQVGPVRTLQGQATLQSRTNHAMAVDPIHDEMVVPNTFAQAILFFHADARGNEKPLRVIQGPKTLIGGAMDTDNVAVDPIHNEVYLTQRTSDSVLVFDRQANGDVAPIRVIHGPKTRLRFPNRVAVDPVNNLVAVSASSGVLLFNRTDNGDVAPHCVIWGPKTGLPHFWTNPGRVVLNPAAKKLIVSGRIWKYGDCGDVPPLYRLEGFDVTDLIPDEKAILDLGGGGEVGPGQGEDSVKIFSLPEAY
ncbi:MAG: hypothetical protein HY315_00505 [Acidobacteria bacterium]|nr:hypothetical protein [Acidobacteriota bacterium]